MLQKLLEWAVISAAVLWLLCLVAAMAWKLFKGWYMEGKSDDNE